MPSRSSDRFRHRPGQVRPTGVVLLTGCLIFTCQVMGVRVSAQTTEPPADPAGSITEDDPSPTTDTVADTPAPTTSPAVAMAALMGSDTQDKRVDAAITIIQIGSLDGYTSLTEVLNQKNSESAKAAICEAIMKTGSKEPLFIEPLLRIARSSDATLGPLALKALSHYDDPEVVGQVTFIKNRQEHARLIDTVRELDRKLYELTPENEKLAYLEGLLNDRALAVRRVTGLEILHRDLSTRKPQDTLLQRIRALLMDENPAVVRWAVVVLRDLRQKSDAVLLREVLKTQNNLEVRETIYNALGLLSDPESIMVCAEALDRENEKVAAQAASSLGLLAGHNPGPSAEHRAVAVEALLSRVERPMEDTTLRTNVAEAMAKIAAPEFVPVFVAALTPPGESLPAVRQSSIRGLATLQSTEHLGAILRTMASDSDVRVREVAAEAVGRIGKSVEVLEPLRERLGDSSEAVVKAAWTSYLAVIERLSPAERMAVVEGWNGNDANTQVRRVELLNHLAKLTDTEASQRVRLSEQAGDELVTMKRSLDAGGAYSRALELTPAGDVENRKRLAGKLLDAYLSISDATRALDEAAKFKLDALRELAAGKFHAYASGLGNDERKAFLDQLTVKFPDRFGPKWAIKFQELVPKPPTQPATSTAPAT